MAAVRVLLVSESDAMGGVEAAILQLADHVDRARVALAAFVPDAPGAAPLRERLVALGVDVTAGTRRRGRYAPAFVAGLLRTARRFDADVVHLHLNDVRSCEHLVLPLRAAGRWAILATEHIDAHGRPRLPRVRDALKRVNGRVLDGTFVVSRSLERLLTGRYGFPADRVWRTGNAVDTARFADAGARAGTRDELGLAPDEPLLFTAARLDAQKGLANLVDAAPAVLARHARARFLVAGEGPLRGALEARVRAAGGAVPRRFAFLGQRADVPALLAAADLFVLPSLFEGMPLSVLEAMAAGRPVIATAVSGTPDVVEDGVTGLLVPPGDAAALARALVRVLDDPALAARLGAAGRELVRREHDVRVLVSRVTERYEAAAQGRRAGRRA